MRTTSQKHLLQCRQTLAANLFSIAIASLPLVTGCVARQSAVPTPETPAVTSSVAVKQSWVRMSPKSGDANADTRMTIGPSDDVDFDYGIAFEVDNASKSPSVTIRGKGNKYHYVIRYFADHQKGLRIEGNHWEYPSGTEIEIRRADGLHMRYEVTTTKKHEDLPAEIRKGLDEELDLASSDDRKNLVSYVRGMKILLPGSDSSASEVTRMIESMSAQEKNGKVRLISRSQYKAGSEVRITKPDGKKIYRKLDRDMTWEELPAEIREAFTSVAPGTELIYTENEEHRAR